MSRYTDELSLCIMSRDSYERCPDLKHRWGHKLKVGKLKSFPTFFFPPTLAR